MKLQEGESIIHELRPKPKVLWIWIFTKCFPFVFIGAFFIFWFFSVFEGIFLTATHSESFWPIIIAVMVTFIIVPVFFIVSLIYCRFLRRIYVYYITNQRCIFRGGILRIVERSTPTARLPMSKWARISSRESRGFLTSSFLPPVPGMC